MCKVSVKNVFEVDPVSQSITYTRKQLYSQSCSPYYTHVFSIIHFHSGESHIIALCWLLLYISICIQTMYLCISLYTIICLLWMLEFLFINSVYKYIYFFSGDLQISQSITDLLGLNTPRAPTLGNSALQSPTSPPSMLTLSSSPFSQQSNIFRTSTPKVPKVSTRLLAL